jgi:hypothetical protein
MLEPSPVQRDVKAWNADHGASMNNADLAEVPPKLLPPQRTLATRKGRQSSTQRGAAIAL